VLAQPNLGTAVLIMGTGAAVLWCAGVHWAYFAVVFGSIGGAVFAVLESRGTPWQLLHDYQYRRIDTFLDPTTDPAGGRLQHHPGQDRTGLGRFAGKGFMQGHAVASELPAREAHRLHSQHPGRGVRLPGLHHLLVLYGLILLFLFSAACSARDRFSSLLITGIGVTFFLSSR
jgi:rod shape determining protein RodA